MSDNIKRRRRRTGSTSARFNPSLAVPMEAPGTARIGMVEIAGCGAVAVVALALAGLIWIFANRAVDDQRTEVLERAKQALSGQAGDIAETIGHELAMIEQSLVILQAAWKADSDRFDLDKWRQEMPALTGVSDDLFICDDKHIIRQDILPQAVGQGVGAAYVNFPHGSLESFQSDGSKAKDSLLLQADAGTPVEARMSLVYLIRQLDHPAGWLIGASYRSSELTRLFARSQLGGNSLVALLDTRRGMLEAVVGPVARQPMKDLSRTPLFGIVTREPSGTWTGDSAIDGVKRLHAFHRVGDRDIVVLVASDLAEVMALADNLASGTNAVAIAATGLVAAIAALVMRELLAIRGNRRQERIAARNRTELDRLRGEEAANTARATIGAARLRAVLDGVTDGIAVFDSGLRLVAWNKTFSYRIGAVPLQEMPLDVLLREQVATGMFGPIEDVDAEVARRLWVLRSGDPAGLPQPGPSNEQLLLRGLPIAEGGVILLLDP